MRWESSGVVGFDLGPLLQGQVRIAKLKSAYNSLIIGPRGFGALSLRWIQFASVLRCARSSLILIMSTPLGVDILFLLFPASGVRTLGFRSFEGKVFILSLPNLLWVFIGLIACMGLLLVKIGL